MEKFKTEYISTNESSFIDNDIILIQQGKKESPKCLESIICK